MTLEDLAPKDRRIYEVLCQSTTGMTMGEVFDYLECGKEPKTGVVFERLDPTRLQAAGLAVRSAKRRMCESTGHPAYSWHAVPFEKAQPITRRPIEKRFATLLTGLRNIMGEIPEGVRPILETMINKAQNP